MNSLQRAVRSVARKPVKSILLLLTTCVISLFLLAAMAGRTADVATRDSTRKAIGAGILLENNETNRSKRIEDISKRIGENQEGFLEGVHQEKLESDSGIQWFSWTDHSFETLKLEDIEKIAAVPGISGYNITTTVTAVNPVNFQRIEDPEVDQSGDVGGVSLIGNLDMTMDSNVMSGNVTIKEGRMTGRKDSGVCVISEELAEQNGLKTGDRLQFNGFRDQESPEVSVAEIVGIYQVNQKMAPYMSGDTYRSENVIFTDLRFPEKAEKSADGPLFEKAYFQVGDVDRYDEVKEAVKRTEIDWERYDLIDRSGNLELMASNFHDLEKISGILLWIVAGASFVILFLIFVFWIKNRVNEIGILLSLGISKPAILGQILTEALMIGAAAVCLSFLAAPAVSKAAAGYLASREERQAEIQQEADAGKVASDYQRPELTVTGVDVLITPRMLLLDGGGIALLTAASVSAAGIIIFRKNPKDILSEMS